MLASEKRKACLELENFEVLTGKRPASNYQLRKRGWEEGTEDLPATRKRKPTYRVRRSPVFSPVDDKVITTLARSRPEQSWCVATRFIYSERTFKSSRGYLAEELGGRFSAAQIGTRSSFSRSPFMLRNTCSAALATRAQAGDGWLRARAVESGRGGIYIDFIFFLR